MPDHTVRQITPWMDTQFDLGGRDPLEVYHSDNGYYCCTTPYMSWIENRELSGIACGPLQPEMCLSNQNGRLT